MYNCTFKLNHNTKTDKAEIRLEIVKESYSNRTWHENIQQSNSLVMKAVQDSCMNMIGYWSDSSQVTDECHEIHCGA